METQFHIAYTLVFSFLLWINKNRDSNDLSEQIELIDPIPPLGYCSHIKNVSKIGSVVWSAPCFVPTEVRLYPPPGYCSHIKHISNITLVGSSVPCFILTNGRGESGEKIVTSSNNLLVLLGLCSKLDHQNGSTFYASSVYCSTLTTEKAYDEISLGCLKTLQSGHGCMTLLYTVLTVSFIGNAIILYLWFQNMKRKPIKNSTDWIKIEEETKRKLEEALQHRRESEERRRIRRENFAKESERRAHETLLALIGSLTLPLVEETRNFNEWMQSPD